MIPFPMIVGDELGDRPPEVALAERNHPVEALFFDRSHEALGVGIRVRGADGRQHDANPRVAEHPPHVCGPFAIAIADQDSRPTEKPVVSGRERAPDLAHEQVVRMRRGPHDLDAAGREIDDEHRVLRDEASPRPDLCREEVGASDRAPVRTQEGLPRSGPFRHGQ